MCVSKTVAHKLCYIKVLDSCLCSMILVRLHAKFHISGSTSLLVKSHQAVAKEYFRKVVHLLLCMK